jgi:hypothetical protein
MDALFISWGCSAIQPVRISFPFSIQQPGSRKKELVCLVRELKEVGSWLCGRILIIPPNPQTFFTSNIFTPCDCFDASIVGQMAQESSYQLLLENEASKC